MTDKTLTIPCTLCGTSTPMLGTKLCDWCWELDSRTRSKPTLARKIIANCTPMPNKIIELKTELTGSSHGKRIDLPYRCRLIQFEGDEYITFQPGQTFADGSVGWLGGWSLMTLLENMNDGLFIDAGQDWSISGVRIALREALEHITFGWRRRTKMDLTRLDELDKKNEIFYDDIGILTKQELEALTEMGASTSEDERAVLTLRVISLHEAVMVLEPLTPDEIVEREALAKQLREEKRKWNPVKL